MERLWNLSQITIFMSLIRSEIFETGSKDTFSVRAFKKSLEAGFLIIDLKSCP